MIPVSDLHAADIGSLNYDAVQTVGWPTYVSEIAAVYRRLPAAQRASAALLTTSLRRGRRDRPLRARSGAAPGLQRPRRLLVPGPPPASATTIVAVGFDRGSLERAFGSVRLATRLDNHLAVNNDNQRAPVWICSRPRASWQALWPMFRYLG